MVSKNIQLNRLAIRTTPTKPIISPDARFSVSFSSVRKIIAAISENSGIEALTAPANPDSNNAVPSAKP